MKRTLLATMLALALVLALAVPALASYINFTTSYEMDGVIDLKKQAGHFCNTGAEVKQTIKGSGHLTKDQTIEMSPGIISMTDVNDGVAGATTLAITTVWHLCAPPKYTYEDADGHTAVVSPLAMYRELDQPRVWLGGGPDPLVADSENYWDAATYDDWEAVSNQIWAVQVIADPGFSINIHQDGEAAHGPYEGYGTLAGRFDPEKDKLADLENRWMWDNKWNPVVGPDFVGSYFNMDQMARTSQGVLKRYIDISSPFNHGYLMEDMSVTGKSEITEAFRLTNLPKGSDIIGLWWDLF